MTPDEIAREVLVGHTFIAVDRKRYVGLLAEPVEQRIATALRAAEARGYERAREQAAMVILTQCHDDMTRDEEAAAIRATQPEDKP